MGSQSSTVSTFGIVSQGKPLTPQRNFEATINKRFIRAEPTTLEFTDQFWNAPREHEIEIRDVTHNRVLFRVPPPSTQRQLLLDAYGVPIVGLEQHPIEPPSEQSTAFAVIPGGRTVTEEIFRFTTQFYLFEYRLKLNFNDYKNSPDRVRILVVGVKQWLCRNAAVAIQRDGEKGDMVLIAQQKPVGDIRDGKYHIEVAAGVDLSLIALFAAAMDEMSPKFATYEDRHNVKIQVKAYLKAQKREQKRKLKEARSKERAEANGNPPQGS